jgi:hypothetical protein
VKPETIDHLAMGVLVAAPGIGFLIAITCASLGMDVQAVVWTALGAFGMGAGAAKAASGGVTLMKKSKDE